jgi:hypothetical protein
MANCSTLDHARGKGLRRCVGKAAELSDVLEAEGQEKKRRQG